VRAIGYCNCELARSHAVTQAFRLRRLQTYVMVLTDDGSGADDLAQPVGALFVCVGQKSGKIVV
jgi:hypothetical protein